jgi:hypothetical protein
MAFGHAYDGHGGGCREWLGDERCLRHAECVVLPTPEGRPPAVGGPYCDAHGGLARSHAEAERDWNYAAPATVGDAAAVDEAGHMALCSIHACVVVRPEHGRWLAWLGIGGLLQGVANPHASVRHRGGVGRSRQRRSSGRYAFPTREAALEVVVDVWRETLRARVAEIRAARGGAITWGMPVEPRTHPIIYVLGEHGSAWDAEPIYGGSCGA